MEKLQEKATAPEKRKRGQPAFKPTTKHRNDVQLFKAAGLSEQAIAAALKISHITLRKYFAVELDIARGVERAKNLKRMVKAANKGSVTAQKALHVIFEHGDKSDLLQDPDFGVDRSAASQADKIRARVTKKELLINDAINAGANNEWAEDLPPPPGTLTN